MTCRQTALNKNFAAEVAVLFMKVVIDIVGAGCSFAWDTFLVDAKRVLTAARTPHIMIPHQPNQPPTITSPSSMFSLSAIPPAAPHVPCLRANAPAFVPSFLARPRHHAQAAAAGAGFGVGAGALADTSSTSGSTTVKPVDRIPIAVLTLILERLGDWRHVLSASAVCSAWALAATDVPLHIEVGRRFSNPDEWYVLVRKMCKK